MMDVPDIWQMREDRSFTDLKIISADEGEVYAHAPILAANVSQWRNALNNGYEEDQVVLAPDYTEEEILRELQTVYSFNADGISEELTFLGFKNITVVEEIYAIIPSHPEPLSILPKEVTIVEEVVESDRFIDEEGYVKTGSSGLEIELPMELPNCPPCGLVYMDFEDLEKHFMLHMSNKIPVQCKKIYRCPICSHRELFKSRPMFARHLKRHHKAEKCFYCYKFLKAGQFSNHACEKALYCCVPCEKRFKDMEEMVHHKNMAHKYCQCQFCHNFFRHEDERDSHEETCIRQVVVNARKNYENHPEDVQGDSFECPNCEAILKSVQLLRNHLRLKHIEKVGTVAGFCLICNLEVKKATEHVNMHLPEKYRRHKCQFCDSRFNDKVKKEEHERLKHTKEATLKCRYCERMFMDSARRATHHQKCLLNPAKIQISDPALRREPILDDDGQPVYSCEACEDLFEYEDELVTHQQENHLENHCRFCMGFFMDVQSKEEHEEHCNKPPAIRGPRAGFTCKDDVQGTRFECLHCDEVTSSVKLLKEHMKVKHCQQLGKEMNILSAAGTAGSKLCLVCQRGFNNWVHVELHLKEEYLRHGCEYCDRRFGSTTKRDEHVRVHHTKERSEICIYCGAGFMESATKAGHQRTCSKNPNKKIRSGRKRKATREMVERRDVVNDQIFALINPVGEKY